MRQYLQHEPRTTSNNELLAGSRQDSLVFTLGESRKLVPGAAPKGGVPFGVAEAEASPRSVLR